MIEVKELSKSYPGVTAVDRISFTIPSGEIVGFLGPNGAGKSTTMRILTGYIAPSSGLASVGGHDVARDSMAVRRLLGYLPESNPLYTEMRVREFLRFRAALKEVPRRERQRAVDEALADCGLTDVGGRVIGHLSKGYRQRVGLADAIIHHPQVIVLDEPTIGLDPNQVREVRELIRRLGEKRTVILSTHILSEVEIMCGRVIIIHKGTIRADGNHRELARHHQLRRSVRLELRAAEGRSVRERIEQLDGASRVLWSDHGATHRYVVESRDGGDLREPLHRLSVQQKWEVLELTFHGSVLEDLFSVVTGGVDA